MNQRYVNADHIGSVSTPSFPHRWEGTDLHEDSNSYSDSNSKKNQPLTWQSRETIEEVSSLERTKQILLIDDDDDSCLAIKASLESYFNSKLTPTTILDVQVTAFVDPINALLEFKPYFYDLLLVDINMPGLNGYELVEKIVRLDLNIKICFMTSGEINYEALNEIRHPSRSFGCFIKKPATGDYLINRIMQELY
jgi:CheY-like chemotaxis protein